MHKAVRTQIYSPSVSADTALRRQGGRVGKQLLETNGRLENPVVWVMGVGLGTPRPQPVATYSPAPIMGINQLATNVSGLL